MIVQRHDARMSVYKPERLERIKLAIQCASRLLLRRQQPRNTLAQPGSKEQRSPLFEVERSFTGAQFAPRSVCSVEGYLAG
jgi:hypothetical protein